MSTPSIEALLTERAGYVMRGLPSRVAAVDAELARLGYSTKAAPVVEAAVEPAEVETAALPKPRRGR